ncbi:hypothetical protein [uncultured Mucilaginibacter sp.]|uniref:hypothetical protein n=1 Tax=uncultured Mucilaginibacter sp. TaxID=797541 RepID=UPI0025E07876|nr:hypothetical protein [uncultured Mucilaginibacter sp.]
MEHQFDAVLTGSDSKIEGVVDLIAGDAGVQAYEFKSLDDSLHLIIARNEDGNWERIGGTDPYFSGWVDELAEQIGFANSAQSPIQE